jgi:hypothetical protein
VVISKTEERQVICLSFCDLLSLQTPVGEAGLLASRNIYIYIYNSYSSEGAEAVGVVVAAGGVRVAALVHGDHHAAVRRQPLHPLLHSAVAVSATEVAPACIPTSTR